MRCCCLLAVFLLPSISLTAADFIKLGSFNIERCGSRTPGQQPIAIAEHIDLSGANILALQEIDVTDTEADDAATPEDETKRNSVLDTVFALLNAEGDTEWKYELFENRTPGDTSQLCGVAWNAKVINRDTPAFAVPITGSNSDRIWDRRPHAVKFQYQDKTDFVLIPVHMKSNFGSAAQGRRIRKLEAEALVSKLDDVADHFDDEEIIVGGDTNILDQDEQSAMEFADADYRDTNSLDKTTFIGSGSGAPFDRFFVADKQLFRFARQYILKAAEPVAHDTFLSDHEMILLAFRVREDND